ncbi:MAG: helix-turn-helix transcriptional regulator [Hungatella hathewayi]|nr:helix-turn-helix transcriptional regulator [Hungatella hathewayi]
MCHMEDVMIKENRKKMNLTQEQLAEQLGISWRQLQRIEKNENQTKIVTLKKIIEILKISDVEILNFMHDKSK